MNLLQAVALNGLTSINQINRAVGSAYSSSFANLRQDEVIPGLPTENWIAARFGESSGRLSLVQDDSPGFKFVEATMLMFVPFNTDLSNIDDGRDFVRLDGGGNNTSIGVRQRDDGTFIGWWGNTSNFEELDIEFQPGFAYTVTLRVRGQSVRTVADAQVELYINGDLKWSMTNFQISTATSTTFQGTNSLITSGPGYELYFRDIVVWDEWTTPAGTAPDYYRAEMVTSANMVEDPASTMTPPPFGISALSDQDDDTFYLADEAGEFLELSFTEPSHSVGGPTIAQRVSVESTKGSTENVVAVLNVSSAINTEERTWEDLTTDDPSYRYFATNVSADSISELGFRITSNELPPLP